ncbi:MAG: hypothetical protein HZA29_05155 [Candidatus Omnitrophica bacterium]|nr:hypothetical protein [Candidatus Omnitrophota bacterium]
MPIKPLNNKSFTLSELMIATLIFTLTFAGVIVVFFRCMELSEMARNTSAALNACKSRIASIEDTAFSQITGTYNNTTFTAPNVNGIGVTYVTSPGADLRQVTTSFSWKEKNGRLMGEDANINGQINAGEDVNGNGILDSPVKLTTYIYNTQ